MIKNTVLDVYWADLTESSSGITYGTPAKLCGAVRVAVNPTTNDVKIYESGAAIMNRTDVSGGTIEIDTHTLTEAEKAKLLYGITQTSGLDYYAGADTDAPKRGALGFASLQNEANTGTAGYVCNWFLDVTMAEPSETYETSDNSGPKTDPNTVTFNFVRRPTDRKYRRTAQVASTTAVASFFAAVDQTTSGGSGD